MNDNKANVRKRRLVFSFVVVDDCLDFSELFVDDADDGGGEGLVPLPEDVGVTVVGRIDFFGMVNRRLSFPVVVSNGEARDSIESTTSFREEHGGLLLRAS